VWASYCPQIQKRLGGCIRRGTQYWTPSESDVAAAEQRLKLFLKASKDSRVPEILNNIEKYMRQYRGVILSGQKLIIIRFFCSARTQDLVEAESIVLDGGSCFFNLRYSTRTKAFSHLEINGLG
jgi:hypothetical protein